MGKISRAFLFFKVCTFWFFPSVSTSLSPPCESQGSKSGLYLTLSHLWQAEQEDHNFEANFGSTARPCLQKNLFVEVVCILI